MRKSEKGLKDIENSLTTSPGGKRDWNFMEMFDGFFHNGKNKHFIVVAAKTTTTFITFHNPIGYVIDRFLNDVVVKGTQ